MSSLEVPSPLPPPLPKTTPASIFEVLILGGVSITAMEALIPPSAVLVRNLITLAQIQTTLASYTHALDAFLKVLRRVELERPLFLRTLDEKTGRYIHILDVSKDARFLNETEGILKELNERLNEEGIDTPDLVKKAWKTSE
jgi:hypothetical protein